MSWFPAPIRHKASRIFKEHGSYPEFLWLPLVLTTIFVAQSLLFNLGSNVGLKWWPRNLLASISSGIIFFATPLYMRPRRRQFYLLVATFLIGIIFAGQYIYFSYSGGFIQASALHYANQITSITGTIKTLFEPKLFFFFIGPLLVVCSYFFPAPQINRLSIKRHPRTALFFFVIPLLCFSFVLHKERKETGDIRGLYSRLFNTEELVGKIGIVNYYIEDLARTALRTDRVSADETEFVKSWITDREKQRGNKYFAAAKNRNLIMIQVESLEKFVINKEIDGQEITPNLNQLTKEGIYFPNYYYQSGPGTTADAEFSVLNSLYPLTNAVAFFEKANNKYNALPNLLTKHGYQTIAMHGDAASFWNRSNIYPTLGFKNILDIKDFSMSRHVNIGLSRDEGLGDEEFLNQAAEKIETYKSPFFAFLLTMSSHTPFLIPDDLKELRVNEPSGLTNQQINYLQSLNYTDRAIGNFIKKLKSSGIYDNSVVVIYGDHQSFSYKKNDNDFAKFLGLNNFDDVSYLQNTQVPLIILVPGIEDEGLEGTNNIPASHLDLYPTLVNLMGFSAPKSILGQDIFNTSEPVVTQRANNIISSIVTPTLTYIGPKKGTFKDGFCYSEQRLTNLGNCKAIYDKQTEVTFVSDLLVRGDLLKLTK